MVDCIVPATGPEELALAQDFGIDDAAPVSHEDFRQWVMENDFCGGRPNWDDVGATFTDDVHSYEMMKLRILNAGHQVLANVGELLSLETIADCMSDDLVASFFRKVVTSEILPHVRPVPGMSPQDYLNLVERRFRNPAIRDTTRRVAFDGTSRHSGFVLPIVRDALAAGHSVRGLALVEALWARMCAGRREDGSQIEPNDPNWASLSKVAEASVHKPENWLMQRDIYGGLAEAKHFRDAFTQSAHDLGATGLRTTLERYVD